MSLEIKPKDGFDWRNVTWGRPDSVVSVLCSYCSAVIAEDDMPLRVWREEGYAAQFCDACQEKWFDLKLGADKARKCRVCGCTDDDCRQCIEKTGEPCSWVEDDLCSACRPRGAPGYWMNEASGVLAPAVKAYLERKPLTEEHIAALRAYFRQWIMAPAFAGEDVEALRERIDGLTTKKAIDRWLDDAIAAGIDPL